jgi:DNA-directed RNA polymerase specialized sigma24 family protein
MTGHCSKCGKVWTLETGQGVCQWCNKPSSCQTTTTQPRSIKSRSNGGKRQAEHNGNGYDQLDGEYAAYYKVASRFNHKAKAEDTEDLLHDIILTLAVAEQNNGHKPFTEAAMYRIASRRVADYWRDHYKLTNGLTCCSCSKAQRQKCREDDLYTECPKAIKLEYLSKPILDTEGNLTELGELIADDKALDLPDWLDTNTFLLGCPDRLIAIAGKIQDGENLTPAESRYLYKFRQKHPKRLF